MTAGPFSTTRVYLSFAITVLRHGNRFDDRTPLKLLSLPHLPPHVTVLVAHPFILPPPTIISLQLLHPDTRIPIPTCALDRFTSTQFPNTSSHSGSHASQNTPSRSTRREHEYYAHRVSATHFNHGGSLHPSQRRSVHLCLPPFAALGTSICSASDLMRVSALCGSRAGFCSGTSPPGHM